MSTIEERGVYDPPAADELPPAGASSATTPFFAVSLPKLVALNLASLGLYTFYWFYKNWKLTAERQGRAIRPFWRAVFYIFYTHELFKSIALTERANRLRTGFDAGGLATAMVLLAIAGRIADRISWRSDDFGLADLVGIAALIASTAVLCRVQRVVNLTIGDPEGALNSQFSLGNVLVLLLGGVAWAGTFALAVFPEWFADPTEEVDSSYYLPTDDGSVTWE